MKTLLAFLFAAAAQAQIGLNGNFTGPVIDYWATHADMIGDTNYCVETAVTYANGASAGTRTQNIGDGNGTVTKNGKIVCTLNDGGRVGAGNIQLYTLTLDITSATNTTTTLLNAMTSFGVSSGDKNVPAGWNGLCTTGHGVNCNWKSAKPISVNGWIILPVYRQDVSPYYQGSDATLVASPDGGAHWCNPYTYFNRAGGAGCDSVNWKADGDAPLDPSTAQYTDATHSSMIRKDVAPFTGATNRMALPAFFDYCQDNSCTGMPNNADNVLYAFGQNGLRTRVILARVTKTIGNILDPAQWSYYNSTGYSPSNVGDGTSWTSTIASALDVFGGTGVTGGLIAAVGITYNLGVFLNPTYLCANGGCSYVAAATQSYNNGTVVNNNQLVPMASPAPWGPYRETPGAMDNGLIGFWSFLRWTAWTPDSTPYHSRVITNWDTTVHNGSGTLYFQSYDLSLAPPQAGSNLLGNTPLRFSMGRNTNALIRNGLQRYFDFDLAFVTRQPGVTNVTAAELASYDLTHFPPTAQMICGLTNGIDRFGYNNPTNGMQWDAQGVAFLQGLNQRCELRDLVQSTGSVPNFYGALNDATFTANGGDTPFSISAVFKTTDITLGQALFNAGPSQQQAYLSLAAGGSLGLIFQIAPVVYIGPSTATGVVANNTWYNAVMTYAAGGQLNPGNSSSRVHVYVNGAEVATTYGSYPASTNGTPNIGAGSITAGFSTAGSGVGLQGTMAGLGWYNRVLSPGEVQHNYGVLKAALKRRAIALP